MLELNELQRLAEEATPGPWFVDEDDRPGMSWNRHIYSGPNTAVCFMAHSDGKGPERDEATAKLIAAMSPDTAKKLIAVARAADNHCAAKQAAEVLSESVDVEAFFRANDRANEAFFALRTALEELKGKTE